MNAAVDAASVRTSFAVDAASAVTSATASSAVEDTVSARMHAVRIASPHPSQPLVVPRASADTPRPLRLVSNGGAAPLTLTDGVMLTEAGWCKRCKDDWDNEDNGCKSMRSEKEDNCNYSSSSTETTTESTDETTTESTDTTDSSKDRDSSSGCKIDEKKPSKSRADKKYYFEIYKKDALCLDKDKEKYEYGQYDDVSKFSSCAKKCVEKGPSTILKKLQGYNWNCRTKKCRCLYDEGTLKSKYDFDEYKTSDRDGKGSVKKTSKADNWNCAKLDKVSADLAMGHDAKVSRRGLRGAN